MRPLAQSEFQFPEDGRQSVMATAVARGTRRLLRAHGHATVTELPLADGRRADIVALAADGTITIIEIKSSVADYRADAKWRFYQAHCDRLLFAIPPVVPATLIPTDVGVIVADAYGAEIIRDASEKRLAAATRKAMFIRFGLAAAHRLHRLGDPDGWDEQQGLF